jgi:hypothetical protein
MDRKAFRDIVLGIVNCAAATLLLIGLPLIANDVIYLHGQVQMAEGGQPGRTVEIKLACGAAQPVRQTVTDKKGRYNLKVERDEFNHVARALPATAMEIGERSFSGQCTVIAVLTGYQSNRIDLATYTIPEDLTLPKLVLKN